MNRYFELQQEYEETMTSLRSFIVATTAALNSILLEQTQYLESLPMDERIELLRNRDSRCIDIPL